jgi:hypothetical protein
MPSALLDELLQLLADRPFPPRVVLRDGGGGVLSGSRTTSSAAAGTAAQLPRASLPHPCSAPCCADSPSASSTSGQTRRIL